MKLKNVKTSDNYNDLKAQFNALKTIVISKSAEIEVYKRKIEEFSVERIIKLEAQLESEKQMNSILTEELENKFKQMYSEEDLHKAYCAGSGYNIECLELNQQYYMFKEWLKEFKNKQI
jgi:predicted RNase H-like nuclease (RuvC/YqgF family)